METAIRYVRKRLNPEIINPDVLSRLICRDVFHCELMAGSAIDMAQKRASLDAVVAKINRGMPLQYATNIVHFYGLRLYVDQRVLIPRPETEELVHCFLEEVRNLNNTEGLQILDIGTGSGCIALAISEALPRSFITGVDNSAAALEVAKKNARDMGKKVHYVCDDICKPSSPEMLEGRWHSIVSNPPYIEDHEKTRMDESVLKYEPQNALFAPQGCQFIYERIFIYAQKHLLPGGCLFLELNEYKAKEIEKMASQFNFAELRVIHDMQGKPRILRCKKY